MKITFRHTLDDNTKLYLFDNGTWKRNGPNSYEIGDIHSNGGIVSFVNYNSNGEHGLVCQMEDLEGKYRWGPANAACKALGKGWRLPTNTELNSMYENLKRNKLGGFSNDIYWSSTSHTNLHDEFNKNSKNPLLTNPYLNNPFPTYGYIVLGGGPKSGLWKQHFGGGVQHTFTESNSCLVRAVLDF